MRTHRGGRPRSSTRCTSAASPTATATASATSPGLRSRLPYLAELGVDAIWINPWYPSPMADAGYDVADYRDIEPRVRHAGRGRGADRARRTTLGIRVLLDIVPNHTSDQHAWFQAGPGCRARLASATGTCSAPVAARTASCRRTTGRACSAGRPGPGLADGGQWYLHLFAPGQPDLNWAQPRGAAPSSRTCCAFWFDQGVDGFRIDVAHGLVKADGLPDAADADAARAGAARRSRTRPGTRTACTTSTAAGARWPILCAATDLHRRGVGAQQRAAGPVPAARTSCTPRSSSTSCARRGGPSLRDGDRRRDRRRRVGRRAADLGAVQPRRRPRTCHAVRAVAADEPGRARLGAAPLGRAGPTTSSAGAGAGGGAAAAGAARHAPTSTRARSWACPRRSRTCPTTCVQDPTWVQSGFTDVGRDGCRVPLPWSGDVCAIRLFGPVRRRPPGCRSRTTGVPAPWPPRTTTRTRF